MTSYICNWWLRSASAHRRHGIWDAPLSSPIYTHPWLVSTHQGAISPAGLNTNFVCVCVCVWGEQFKACRTSTGKVSEDTRQRFYSFACAFLFPTRGSCILLRAFYSNRRMEGGRKISPVWRWRTRRWAERRWTRSWQSGRSASALGRCGCSPAAPLISWRREDKRWGGENRKGQGKDISEETDITKIYPAQY